MRLIVGVCDERVTAGIHRDALRENELPVAVAGAGAPPHPQKGAIVTGCLDAVIAAIRHVQIAMGIHGEAGGERRAQSLNWDRRAARPA